METPLTAKIILYTDISLMGLISIILLIWQIQVLRGGSMKNPDGSVDDWHVQRLCYGIALTDIAIAIPVTLLGIILIYLDYRLGHYLTAMTAFWFLWINAATTVTSLRFEKPKMTAMWFIVFPFGSIVGLIYLIWSLIYFKQIYEISMI